MLVSLYHKLAIKHLAASKNLFKATGHRKKAGNLHQPWFTEDLLRDKRRLNQYNRWLTKHPDDSKLRSKLFQLKREHKKNMRVKKEEYVEFINKEIEDGNNISWDRFKDLKCHREFIQQLDFFDMANFTTFFKDLNQKRPATSLSLEELKVSRNLLDGLTSVLNKDISDEELDVCIQRLKNNKAVSEDLICNEFLKNSNDNMRRAILKVFNE